MTLTQILTTMQVQKPELREALRWAVDDATREALAATASAQVMGRQGAALTRATGARLALAVGVLALVEVEWAREEAAAERQALVMADLANSADREDA